MKTIGNKHMAWQCPRCHEDIDSLNYSVPTEGSEFGSAQLSEENSNIGRVVDHDCNDSNSGEWSGDVAYECPECNRELEVDDLIWVPDTETDEPVEASGNRSVPADLTRFTGPQIELHMENRESTRDAIVICLSCKKPFAYEQNNHKEEIAVGCPFCGEDVVLHEFKTKLKEGFFNSPVIHIHGTRKQRTKS